MRGSVVVQPVRSVSERRFSPLPGARAWLFLLAALLASLLIGAPSASATVVAPESPVAADGASKRAPAISGDLAVWADDRGVGGGDIYIRDLSPGGVETQVTNDLATQANPSISGSFVVWQDNSSGNWDIYGLDLSTLSSGGQPFVIAAGAGDQRNPDISGDFVVWEDGSGGDWDVRGRTLPSGAVSDIATGAGDQRSPAVSGERVVWQQTSSAGEADIIFKDLSSGAQKQLNTAGGWRQAPDISGDTVVWRDERTAGDLDIYAYDLAGGGERRLTEGVGDQWAPEVSGRVVVWADDRGAGSTDIYGEDISNGDEFAVSTSSGPQDDPAVDGDRVIWVSQRDGVDLGVYDIYGTTLDLAPAAPSGLRAAGSTGGVSLSWEASLEADLAGYNLYRSDALDGTYTKLSSGPLSATSYTDTSAPKGSVSFYRLTAVDAVGGESGKASASAAAIAPSGLTLTASPLRIDLGGSTNLSGRLTAQADAGTRPASGERILLDARPAGQTGFSQIKSALTAADGRFSFAGLRPASDTEYRARFAGDPVSGMDQASSASVGVDVVMKPALTLSASPVVLDYGQATTLFGSLTLGGRPLSGEHVVLEQRAAGASSFTAVAGGQLITNSNGGFSLAGLKPTQNTEYRARFAGDANLEAAVSGATPVSVKAKVNVVPPKVTTSSHPKVSISGKVVTARAGKVRLIITRNGKVIATKFTSLSDSRFGLRYRPPGKGRYTVKAAFPKTASHLGNTSPIRRMVVR